MNWAARLAPREPTISGTAIGPDGSIFVAGTSNAGPANNPREKISFFVSRISSDGSRHLCTSSFVLSSAPEAPAFALAADQSVWIAGVTYDPNFPFTTTPQNPSSERAFLINIDPCSPNPRLALELPEFGQPQSIAIASDKTLYVALRDGREPVEGFVFSYAWPIQSQSQPSGRVALRGIPAQVVANGEGNIFVTGYLPLRRAFVMKASKDLRQILFDSTLGNETASQGHALLPAEDGGVWVATAEWLPEKTGFPGFSRLQGFALPLLGQAAAIVHRLSSSGQHLRRIVFDYPELEHESTNRRPLYLWEGPDGRIWTASYALAPLPLGAPLYDSTQFRPPLFPLHQAILLRAISPDGEPEHETTAFPIFDLAGLRPAFASKTDGSFLLALPTSLGQPTGGALDHENGQLSFFRMDLAAAASAPKIIASRDYIESFTFLADFLEPNESRGVNIWSSNGENIRLYASLAPDVSRNSTVVYDGLIQASSLTLPTSYGVKPVAPRTPIYRAFFAFAPGSQGTLTLPILQKEIRAILRISSLNGFTFPSAPMEPFDLDLEFSMNSGIDSRQEHHLELTVRSDSSWVSLPSTTGVTPFIARARIDLSKVPRTPNASAEFTGTGVNQSWKGYAPFSFGPALRRELSPRYDNFIPVNSKNSYRGSLRLWSTGAPIAFSLRTSVPWLHLSQSSGQTPATVDLSIDIARFPESLRMNHIASVTIQTGNEFFTETIYFVRIPDTLIPRPGSQPPASSPGGIVRWAAGTLPCAPSIAPASQWPEALGNCRIRIAGKIAALGKVESREPFRQWFDERVFDAYSEFLIQIPLDLPLGSHPIEVLNESGTVLFQSTIHLRERAPVFEGSPFLSPLALRPGDPAFVRITGLGPMSPQAPLGTTSPGPTTLSKAPKLYFGGRLLKVLETRLSRFQPGEVELHFEIPNLSPGLYPANLRMEGELLHVGEFRIQAP